jgi:hypothetical protein
MILFLLSFFLALGTDPEVDQYIRSMTQIKPNWSDEKILTAARRIYGTAKVPSSIENRYVGRPGNVPTDWSGKLSTDERKKLVYMLQDKYPTLSATRIAARFASEYPMVENPPSEQGFRGYLRFRNVEEGLANIPQGSSVHRMVNEDRQRIYLQGKARMAKMMSENPDLGWEDIVRKTAEEFYDEHEIKLNAETVYKWYARVKKDIRNDH